MEAESLIVSALQYERLKAQFAKPVGPERSFAGLPVYESDAMPEGFFAVVEPPRDPTDHREAWERTKLFRYSPNPPEQP